MIHHTNAVTHAGRHEYDNAFCQCHFDGRREQRMTFTMDIIISFSKIVHYCRCRHSVFKLFHKYTGEYNAGRYTKAVLMNEGEGVTATLADDDDF